MMGQEPRNDSCPDVHPLRIIAASLIGRTYYYDSHHDIVFDAQTDPEIAKTVAFALQAAVKAADPAVLIHKLVNTDPRFSSKPANTGWKRQTQ